MPDSKNTGQPSTPIMEMEDLEAPFLQTHPPTMAPFPPPPPMELGQVSSTFVDLPSQTKSGSSTSRSTAVSGSLRDYRNFRTAGNLTIPMLFCPIPPNDAHVSNDGITDDGGSDAVYDLKAMGTTMRLDCDIPPKYGGRFFSSFGAKSGCVGKRGYADTRLSLGCDVESIPGLSLLCDWDASSDRSKMSYGVAFESPNGSTSQAKLHYPSNTLSPSMATTNSKLQRPALSFSIRNREIIPNKVVANAEFGLTQNDCNSSSKNNNHRKRNSRSSLSSLPFMNYLQIHLFTITESSSSYNYPYLPAIQLKLDLGMDKLPLKLHICQGSFQNPLKRLFSLLISPRRVEDVQKQKNNKDSSMMGEFYLALGYQKRFEMRALLTQTLSKVSSFSVGLSHASWMRTFGAANITVSDLGVGGLSWILQWRTGDFCLTIPIWIGSIASAASSTTVFGDSVTKLLQGGYLAFVSGLIQSAVGQLVHGAVDHAVPNTNDNHGNDPHQEQQVDMEERLRNRYQKARSEAENQTLLMKKKAEKNRRSEESKNGLVIISATYGVDGGECMDATTQLQFWVLDSKLQIADTCKSHMLGFYDVACASCAGSGNDGRKESDAGEGGIAAYIKTLLFQTFSGKGSSEKIPVLYAKYKFNDKLYEVSVFDHEELTLPSPHARELIE